MKPITILPVLLIGVTIGIGGTVMGPQEEPKVKTRVYPYPTLLKAAGIEGDVDIRVFVNEQGKVDSAQAVKATNPDFVPSALEAIKKWEFFPATKDGKPIKAVVVVPFRFRTHDNAYKAKEEDLLKLVEDIKGLLRGSAPDSLKRFIDPEAYGVVGKRYEHLLKLVFDRSRPGALIEGKDTKIEFSRSVVDNSDDAAYLVLKTRPSKNAPERFHMIVMMKSAEGRWLIRAWVVNP